MYIDLHHVHEVGRSETLYVTAFVILVLANNRVARTWFVVVPVPRVPSMT